LPLARAAALPVERCARFGQAEAARIIAGRARRNRFIHDLIREVLYEELTATERPLVHLAVAQALQTQPSYHDARHAAVLAHHFRVAAHCGGAAVPSICRFALALCAPQLRVRRGRRALRRSQPAAAAFAEVDQATECAVLAGSGLAQSALVSVSGARHAPTCRAEGTAVGGSKS